MGRLAYREACGGPHSSSCSPGSQHDQVQGNPKKTTSETRSSPFQGFSIGQRSRISPSQDEKRGPGAYMSIWEQSQGPAYSFHKKTDDCKKDFDGPGPGQYSSGTGFQATKASAPAYSMGARCGPSAFFRSAPEMCEGVRGRGNGNGVAFPLAYKSGKNFSLVPGPGSYNTNTMSKGPAFSMGVKKTGKTAIRNQSPGPGAYDVARKTSGPSFSIAPKMRSISQRDMNPGPGSYCYMSDSLNRGVSYTMRERFR